MTTRIALSVLIATLLTGVSTSAQSPGGQAPLAGRFVDPANGLSLEQAIARAIEQEPSLRAARSQVEVAQGTKPGVAQAQPIRLVRMARRTRRHGPPGDGRGRMAARSFRRSDVSQSPTASHGCAAVCVGSRAPAGRRGPHAIRRRPGDDSRSRALRRNRGRDTEPVRPAPVSRRTGASPPLERDLLDVELRRVQADRLLQAGRTEAAVFELKRVLGMKADATLTVRDTFEALVQRESAVAPQVRDASTAVEQRLMREAAARIDTAVAKIDRAESEGRFDVSLFGNYMRMDAGFPQRGFAPDGGLERVRGQFNYWSAGAMLTIPVLNRNQGEVAVARAERTGAAAAYDAARLAAEAELASARARDERAREAVKIYGAGAQALARQNLTWSVRVTSSGG